MYKRAERDFSYLGKMAPYFGMVATVLGMIRVLKTISDFTNISAHVGTAMAGTLYGLFMFVLVYSPLAKAMASYREELMKRNELIGRWLQFTLERQDAAFIMEDLVVEKKSREPLPMPQEMI